MTTYIPTFLKSGHIDSRLILSTNSDYLFGPFHNFPSTLWSLFRTTENVCRFLNHANRIHFELRFLNEMLEFHCSTVLEPGY